MKKDYKISQDATKRSKTILYFGTYEKSYCRNQILIKSLTKMGHTVKECHVSLWQNKADKLKTFDGINDAIFFLIKLIKAYMLLFIKFLNIGPYDIVFIGYIGHLDILLAKVFMIFTFKKKKIIFDAFISLYDSTVSDRKLIKEHSFLSKIVFMLDKTACRIADIVILDTKAHIDFFHNTFGVPKNKMTRIFASADEDIFYPRGVDIKNDKFNVIFIGKYTPLHGIECIIEAAEVLTDNRDIHFTLIGKGQLYLKIRSMVKEKHLNNIEFIEWVEYEDLPKYIGKADACLGIFSPSEKASRVIPNKVFQSMAMGKPIITARTPAIAESLIDGYNAVLCNPSDPVDLSNAILKLKEDNSLSKQLATNAKQSFLQSFGSKKVAEKLNYVIKIALKPGVLA
jgi:glycosyltransferase involved in cell wall biosynthesis